MHRRLKPVTALLSCVALGAAAADWPQWRGPDRNDVSKETGLLERWPAGGPARRWVCQNAGLGYSGPAVVGDRLYTMGVRGASEFLLALDTETGTEVWATEMGPVFRNAWGDGPRGTPTVSDGKVYALSGCGTLLCAQATDGKTLWKKTMQELGGTVPNWGYAESVLVDGERVVCTPGGRQGAMAALNRETGAVLWQAAEFTEGAQYSSPIVVEVNGVRQYVQLTMRKLAGVAADTGRRLWQSDWPGKTAVIPSPVYHDGCVYVTSGYGVGCKMVRVGADNQVSDVYANTNMMNHHGGVLLLDGHLYGHSDKAGWVCQDFKTGEVVWAGKGGIGKGAVVCAGGLLYCQAENDGTVVLAKVSPEGWEERGRFKIEPQSSQRSPKGKIWTHPVVANGLLYLRDQEFIHGYDVAQK